MGDLAICNSIHEFGGLDTKGNEKKEKEKILHNLTFMQNFKNQIQRNRINLVIMGKSWRKT